MNTSQKLTFVLVGIFYSSILFCQCPQILEAKTASSNCFPGTTTCDLCIGDELILSAKGINLPNDGCVKWFYDTDPNFTPDPDANEVGCSKIIADDPCSICMSIEYVMVHPNGNEFENEFLVFNSGGGFFTSDFFLDFDLNNNDGNDLNSDMGTSECPLMLPTFSLPGCPVAIPIGLNDFIPQNSIVIAFPHFESNPTYDFSDLCSLGVPIYFLQNSCQRTLEAFSNEGNGNSRTQGIGNRRCGCSSYFTYASDFIGTGDFIRLDGTAGNSIQYAPAVNWQPTNLIQNKIEDFSFEITDDLCGNGPLYFKGIIDPFFQGCNEMITEAFEFQVVCPQANIAGKTEICEGEELILTVSGGDTFLWADGQTSENIIDFPKDDFTYSVEVFEANCSAQTEHKIEVHPIQIPVLKTDTICLSSGTYDLSQLVDDDFISGEWSGTQIIDNQLVINSFGKIDLAFQSDEICTEIAKTTIEIYEPISYSNESKICDPATNTYIVEFEINGGEATTLGVDGQGVLVNNIFKSDPILSGENFSFLISDDSPCGEIVFVGAEICICETDAGIPVVSNEPIQFCASEKAIISPNSGVVLDANDELIYALHLNFDFQKTDIIRWKKNPEFEFDPTLMFTGVSYFISAIAGNETQTTGVDFDDDCLSIGQPVTIQFIDPPTAFFLNDKEICEGDEAILQVVFNGSPPFQFEILENGQPFLKSSTNLGVFDLRIEPTQNSTYKVQNFEDANCAGMYYNQEAVVSVLPKIEVSFLDTIFYQNGTYSVQLKVEGGDNNFAFSGSSGRWDSPYFISDPIPCSNLIEVCFSSQSCDEVCYSNTFECQSNCLNYAGTMGSDTLHLCALDSAFFLHEGAVLSNEDALSYILHTNSGTNLGTILKTKPAPNFAYSSDLRLERVYYFSAVSGNSDGNNGVDFSDNCLSVAPGTPVVFHDFPDVDFPSDFTICRDEPTSIELNFIGNPPFNFNYQIDNFSFPEITSNNSEYSLISEFDKERTFSINEISDKYCSTKIDKNLTVAVHSGLTIENLNYVCAPDNQSFIIEFDIDGGNETTYQILGNGTLNGNSFLSDSFLNSESFQFEVYDDLQCDTITFEGTFDCSCGTFAGTLESISNDKNAPKILCGNESIQLVHKGDQLLNSNEKLEFVLHDKPGVELGNVYEQNETGHFSLTNFLTQNKTYYLSAIAGDINSLGTVDLNDQCLNVSYGLPIVFQSLPNASFTVGGEICEGDSTLLGFTFAGKPPFLIHYFVSENGVRKRDSTTSVTNNFFKFYTPEIGSDEVTFELIKVESFGCEQQLNGIQKVNIIPTPKEEINFTLCEDDFLIIENQIYNIENPIDTIRLKNASQNGCDSLVFINLSFENRDTNFIDSTLCEIDFLMVNGVRYDKTNPFGFEVFDMQNCDSLVSINLGFESISTSIITDTLCGGESLEFGGFTFDESNPNGEVTLISENGCDSIIDVNIYFANNLQLEIGNDTTIEIGQEIHFKPIFSGIVNELFWTPANTLTCSDCLQTTAHPLSNTTYQLLIWDDSGCEVQDSITVSVLNSETNFDDKKVYIPNAFSPNNDGINDYFTVFGGKEVGSIKRMMVFDRWGNSLFLGENLILNDSQSGWNGQYKGKILDAGVYLYFTEIEFLDGKIEVFKGDVTIK